MQYDDIHNIVGKNQADSITEGGGKPVTQKATTYDWSYVYSGSQPHAPVHIGNRTFSYDLNGNQLGWKNDDNGTRRIITWDEENRISQIDDNGERNYYTYDAAGERTIKVSRQGQTVYINQYYVVRNRSIVSKHIFAGAGRIATHMEMGNGNTGSFRGNGGGGNGGSGNGSGQGGEHADNGNAYAYGQDKVHGQSNEDHGQSGMDHGQINGQASGNSNSPMGQGSGTGRGNAQGHGNSGNGNGNTDATVSSGEASVDTSNLPGNSEAGLENALSNGEGHKYGIYKHLEKEGDTISNGEIVSSNVAGGTTTVNGQSSFLYYYHPDHLGSTGFVTDGNGKLYEHMEYFPFGETWVDEHSNTLRTPYLFTGKELDQETGLYYFGARYYDPRTSVWQSPDPVLSGYLDGEHYSGIYTPMHLALYTYVRNDPLNFNDPDGNAEVFAIEFNRNAQYGSLMFVWGDVHHFGFYLFSSRRDADGGGIRSGIYPFKVGVHPMGDEDQGNYYTDHGHPVKALNLYADKVGGDRNLPALPYLPNGESSGRTSYGGINSHAGNYVRRDKSGNILDRNPSAGVRTGSRACLVVPILTKQGNYDPSVPATWKNYSDYISNFKDGDTGSFTLLRPGEFGHWFKDKQMNMLRGIYKALNRHGINVMEDPDKAFQEALRKDPHFND